VVHLNSCTSHQSYYTCLSRSATAEGTIIVQGFEPRVITGGCSGYLRQEFREQEILDHITRLRYETGLPHHIDGNRRNTIIRQYQKWKGTSYVPEQVDQHLSWSTRDTMQLLPVVTDTPWQLIDKDSTKSKSITKLKVVTNFVPAQGTTAITPQSTSKKRKTDIDVDVSRASKAQRISSTVSPRGLVWDGDNYSCAYDSLFTVLFDVWKENQPLWNVNVRFLNSKYLGLLGNGFLLVSLGQKTLENVRDEIRKLLHTNNKQSFPYGRAGTSLSDLASEIFSSHRKMSHQQEKCTNCDFARSAKEGDLGSVFALDTDSTVSTSYSLKQYGLEAEENCPMCFSKMIIDIFYTEFPSMLLFDHSAYHIKPSKIIKFNTEKAVKYRLRGLLYFGSFHFTSRILSSEGDVWFHDGIQTGNDFKSQGHSKLMNDEDWQTCEGRKLVMSIYMKV
jgi:hypothetical protein